MAGGSPQSSESIRVVTFNVAGLQGGWFEQRSQAVEQELRRLQPDILCLQEATICHGPSADGAPRVYNQARALGAAAGLRACVFAPYGNPIETMSPDQGGIAIASRFPVTSARSRRLPAPHTDPPDARVALLVSLETPAGELDVVTTHLSWRPDDADMRLVQMGLILDEFAGTRWSVPDARMLLAGDMNAAEDEPALQLARTRLKDAWRAARGREPGHTWAAESPYGAGMGLPDRRLDYVFCPRGVEVRHVEIALDRPCPVLPSDHFALVADLAWPRE